MPNKRDPNKNHVGGHFDRTIVDKLDQLRFEHGNITKTEMIRRLIEERYTYSQYIPPENK
jgi:hypothetical protein